MSHIFISYSHYDKEYVEKLQEALRHEGFNVWTDEGIPYGNQWPTIIEKHLDESDAFIVVMSRNSRNSGMVQNECTRARELKKPVFPLLLDGNTWLIFQATQYFDVRGGSLPTEKFYKWLEVATPRNKTSPAYVPPPPRESLWAKISALLKNVLPRSLPFLRITGMFAFAAVVIWGSTLLIPYIQSLVSSATVEPSATNAPIITPTVASAKTEISDDKQVKMILVPAGEFIMGRDAGLTNESPAHTVKLDDFYIDKYEVTNALYKVCAAEGICQRPIHTNFYYVATRSDRPVVSVTWDMANAYCQWRGAGLPSEAQWEKAARGTDERPYPWGQQSPIVQYANYQGNDSKDVGSYPFVQSPYGAFDLAGNVSEWVSDWYSLDYYRTVSSENISNPTGPSISSYSPSHNFYGRVVRGGSWSSSENYRLSTTYRDHLSPDSYADDLGFRCAKPVTP
jgi:formylglycine-generating enzyme required for sulfatase activity